MLLQTDQWVASQVDIVEIGQDWVNILHILIHRRQVDLVERKVELLERNEGFESAKKAVVDGIAHRQQVIGQVQISRGGQVDIVREQPVWIKTKLHIWTFVSPFNGGQRVVGDGEEVNVHAGQVANLQLCDVCLRDLEVGQVLWNDILWDGGDVEALTMHEQGVASYGGAGGEVVGLVEGNRDWGKGEVVPANCAPPPVAGVGAQVGTRSKARHSAGGKGGSLNPLILTIALGHWPTE